MVVIETRAIMAAEIIPEKIKLAFYTPSKFVFPGHVSLYKYIGLRTGKTYFRSSLRELKTAT
jgi:hypothetical protein